MRQWTNFEYCATQAIRGHYISQCREEARLSWGVESGNYYGKLDSKFSILKTLFSFQSTYVYSMRI